MRARALSAAKRALSLEPKSAAHWNVLGVLCRTLYEPDSERRPHNRYIVSRMHGVSVAVDCLERYNDRIKGDPAALNMYGALLEREGLFRRAAQALRTALAGLDT